MAASDPQGPTPCCSSGAHVLVSLCTKGQADMRCLPVLRVDGCRGLWLPSTFIRVLRFCKRNATLAPVSRQTGPASTCAHTWGGKPGLGGGAGPWTWSESPPMENKSLQLLKTEREASALLLDPLPRQRLISHTEGVVEGDKSQQKSTSSSRTLAGSEHCSSESWAGGTLRTEVRGMASEPELWAHVLYIVVNSQASLEFG